MSRGGLPVCAAVLQHPQSKKQTLLFQIFYLKNKKCKNFNLFCLIFEKKAQKFNGNTADVLLSLKLSRHIKNKHKKLLK